MVGFRIKLLSTGGCCRSTSELTVLESENKEVLPPKGPRGAIRSEGQERGSVSRSPFESIESRGGLSRVQAEWQSAAGHSPAVRSTRFCVRHPGNQGSRRTGICPVQFVPSFRKFFKIWRPFSVRMLSGWNCTPQMGKVLCRTPMISPSSVSAVISKQSGRVSR